MSSEMPQRNTKNFTAIAALRVAWICCALLSAGGCDDEPNRPPEVRLPLEIGTEWRYVQTSGLFNFRPDSSGTPGFSNETFVGSASAAIVRQDSAFDPGPAWVFDKTLYQGFPPDARVIRGKDYFVEREEGLYLVAYEQPPPPVPPKPARAQIRFHGRTFGSPAEVACTSSACCRNTRP